MSDLARRMRSARQAWAAPGSSHDRLIRLLRIALPMGVGVLAAVIVMAPLTSGGDVSFVLDKNKVAVAPERLRIEAAEYRGQDQKGQPFSLTAASGVQRNSADPVVRLRALAARVQLTDGPATIHADRGRYDMVSQSVAMEGPVRVLGPDGYRLDTHDATVDLKTRRMESGSAVTGTVRQGVFSGDRMDADLAQRIVRLDGHARLRIQPGRTK